MQKKIKLSELGQFKNGLNFSKIDVEKPCKMIGVSNFSNYLFPKYTELDSIDSSLVPKEFLLEDGDIVFVRSNGNKNLVGRSMYISNSSEKITFSGFCIRFRPDKEKVNPLFFVLFIEGTRLQKTIQLFSANKYYKFKSRRIGRGKCYTSITRKTKSDG